MGSKSSVTNTTVGADQFFYWQEHVFFGKMVSLAKLLNVSMKLPALRCWLVPSSRVQRLADLEFGVGKSYLQLLSDRN